jgi:hypothetical protein
LETQSKSKSGLDLPVLKKASFYYIKENDQDFILEDRTKRGLTIKEQSIDEKFDTLSDKGMIHDMDGIGHLVVIRWYFKKDRFDLPYIINIAEDIEKKYTELRELTCPDDDQ